MSFLALRFDVEAEHADDWTDALLAQGALSVDISDPCAGTASESPLYGEPGVPIATSWPVARIVALFTADTAPATRLSQAARAVAIPAPPFETYPIADQDWVRQTQAQFGPIEIAPCFWIVPTWSVPPNAAALNLRLDPGLAFGTGSHPTTRLCLEWLQAHIAGGESVLDYGCGSGILAIAARKLGASQAAGTDVDPQAITASAANARLNGVAATFVLPDALAPGVHQILVANILANPLMLLAPALSARVAAGGRIALSGILTEQADAVAAAYARWFTLVPWRQRDGWVLLASRRTLAG